MRSKNLITTGAILILLLFTQCQKPARILGRDKMIAITYDMALTEAYLEQERYDDSIAALYYESVLAKHSVSRAKYDSSVVWYSENVHKLNKIYEEVGKLLEEEQALIDTLYQDSLHIERIRFEPIKSLWTGNTRHYLASDMKQLIIDQSIAFEENDFDSDTLTFSAFVFPNDDLEQIRLRLSLIVTDENGHLIEKHTATKSETSTASKLSYYFVLPSSLPNDANYQLIGILEKSDTPLLLHSIALRFNNRNIEEDVTLDEKSQENEPIEPVDQELSEPLTHEAQVERHAEEMTRD